LSLPRLPFRHIGKGKYHLDFVQFLATSKSCS
jgi:hypothetical protein